MCCFKDFKNYERMNNIVQVAMNMAIKFIVDLPFDFQNQAEQQQINEPKDEQGEPRGSGSSNNKKTENETGEEREESPQVSDDVANTGDGDQGEIKERDSKEEDKNNESVDVESEKNTTDEKTSEQGAVHDESSNRGESRECSSPPSEKGQGDSSPNIVKDPEKGDEASGMEEESDKSKETDPLGVSKVKELSVEEEDNTSENQKEHERSIREAEMEAELLSWTMEEKDRLFNFVTKIFLMNFPLYMAYKHSIHTSLEELSQQEASALNNYCELSVSLLFQS